VQSHDSTALQTPPNPQQIAVPPAPTIAATSTTASIGQDTGGHHRQAGGVLSRYPTTTATHAPGGGGGRSGLREIDLSAFPRETTISGTPHPLGGIGELGAGVCVWRYAPLLGAAKFLPRVGFGGLHPCASDFCYRPPPYVGIRHRVFCYR
jgi:hypothetical protein